MDLCHSIALEMILAQAEGHNVRGNKNYLFDCLAQFSANRAVYLIQ